MLLLLARCRVALIHCDLLELLNRGEERVDLILHVE